MVPQQVSAQEMQLLQEFHIFNSNRSDLSTSIFARCIAGFSVLLLISACSPAADGPRLNRRTLAEATAVLDDVARTELALSPETASRLGMENIAGASATARLDDHSQAGFERRRLIRIDLLARVRSRPLLPSDHAVEKDLIIVEDALARLIALQPMLHGRLTLSNVHPYVIDPYSGIWREGLDLLTNDHRIDTIADADAYLERLRSLSDTIDDTRRRLLANADAGLIPPSPLLRQTRLKISALVDTETSQFGLLSETLLNLSQSLPGITQQDVADLLYLSQATITDDLHPAYQRLLTTLDDLQVRAPSQIGLWAQPNGNRVYQALLKFYVDNEQDLDDLHLANIEAVLRRTRELQENLNTSGFEPAPLVQRLDALKTRRETAIAEAINSPIPENLPQPVLQTTGPQIVSRTFSPVTQSGFSRIAARLDGQRPAMINRNGVQVALWPDYMRSALQLQEDIALRQPFAALSLHPRSNARTLVLYPSLQDAWRLYTSEATATDYLTTPDELTGQMQLLLLDAAMAAADTGLHHKRWSLDQTTEYLTETTGLPEPLMRDVALRITAKPGRAAARMIAYRRLISLKARARGVLGQRYNELSFQSILLTDGPRPFSIIEADVDRWYEALLSDSN